MGTIKSEIEWISTDDRYPSKWKTVLVAQEDDELGDPNPMFLAYLNGDREDEEIEWIEAFTGQTLVHEIVYWTYVPTPTQIKVIEGY